MIYDIVQGGHPALRTKATEVDPLWVGTSEFNVLVADMIETMHAAPGVGLAAPQIGLPIQLVVLEDRPETLENMDPEVTKKRQREVVPLTVLVNPTLETIGRKKVDFYEGCLSISGWAAATQRHHRVRVKALNEKGAPIELDWQGWPARILQHEIDHLAGVLYVDRMDSKTFATTANLARCDDDDDAGS